MKKFFVLIIGWGIAFLILKYRRPIKEFVGNIGFAEKVFGMGGTNTFIVILGVLVFLGTLMYVTGTLQSMVGDILGPLFGR
jgi:hypothetical protein